MPPKKSEAVSESPLFKELCESVAKETHKSTFACGGSIPIVSKLPDNETKQELMPVVSEEEFAWTMFGDTPSNFLEPATRSELSLPIDLRWDSKHETKSSKETKVTFPLSPEMETNLLGLVADCEPATFGKGTEDVFDESYRKASKMDPARFSSTFNPYEVGIVDTIAQVLLPTLRKFQQTRAVKAELYKLNFYSAPSGKFKAHVDTPKSASHFGSLVVCLPIAHQGGALNVNHKGQTITFDWSNSSSDSKQPAIQWAAFYSDCEHEVLEVTQGHRLTLTYNLYTVRGNGFLGDNAPALDPATLPLYKTVRDLVAAPKLWEEGGHIGYFCGHSYPHTSGTKRHFMLPDNLKGADMAMYSIFRALGLKIEFRPAFDGPPQTYMDEPEEPIDENGDYESRTLGAVGKLKAQHPFNDNFELWIGRRKRPRANPRTNDPEKLELVPSYVGYNRVHWVNEPGYRELHLSYTTWGNEYSSGWTYSCLVMVAEIPPQKEVEAK